MRTILPRRLLLLLKVVLKMGFLWRKSRDFFLFSVSTKQTVPTFMKKKTKQENQTKPKQTFAYFEQCKTCVHMMNKSQTSSASASQDVGMTAWIYYLRLFFFTFLICSSLYWKRSLFENSSNLIALPETIETVFKRT